MKTIARAALCLALLTGLAWAQHPKKGAPSPAPSKPRPASAKAAPDRAGLREMTKELAFYFYVAVYGAPADVVDRYARVFDADKYRRAMADEFERPRYRKAVEEMILDRARSLNFDERFVYRSSSLSSSSSAKLKEYAFTGGFFPVARPDTGFSYFNYYVGGNGFEINPFSLEVALNDPDFDWALTMPEGEASHFLKGHSDRLVYLQFVYSLTKETNKERVGRFYLTPFIHSIDIFADRDMTQRVGSMARLATAPRTLQEWAQRQEEIARLVIGTWRDEDSVSTYSADGTRLTRWDDGTTAKQTWTFHRDILEGEVIEKNGKKVVGAGGFRLRVVSYTPTTMELKDSQGKIWHATRQE